MKTGMMGAAVAAMMACGWTGAAEAAPISVSGFISDSRDNSLGFQLSYDPRTFAVVSYNIAFTAVMPDYYSFAANGNSGFVTIARLPNLGVPETELTFTDPSATFDGLDGISFVVDILDAPGPNPVDPPVDRYYQIQRYGVAILSPPLFFTGVPDITYSSATVSNPQVFFLPLPPSAPLFGAGLLAFGGFGYARRRAQART